MEMSESEDFFERATSMRQQWKQSSGIGNLHGDNSVPMSLPASKT
jgi:hypothetical protein